MYLQIKGSLGTYWHNRLYSSSGAVSNCYNQPCQWSTDNKTLRGAWTISFNPSCGYLKWCGGCSSSAHAPVTHLRWPLRWHLVGSNMKGRKNSISPGWTLGFDMAAWMEKGLPSAPAVLCICSFPQDFYGWRVCLESLGTGAFGGQSSVWFSTKRAVNQASGIWVFVGCLCSSFVGNSGSGIVIHPYICIYR